MPYQTPQPRRQMKDLRDCTTPAGTATEQGSRELAGPNLVGDRLSSHEEENCFFQCAGIYGQWGRKPEENKSFSSSQCNCFAIFVVVLSSLITKMVITNRKKISDIICTIIHMIYSKTVSTYSLLSVLTDLT